MNVLSAPKWIDEEVISYDRLDDVPVAKFEEIRTRLAAVVSDEPLVSVVISAWNEELNILKCLDSLSKNTTTVPFEIIVVNNNSTDRTQHVLDRLGVKSYFQQQQGVGPSRELGQQKARGKYVLSADADCVYPERWIDIMSKALMESGNVLVYGRFCYLPDKQHPRWLLFFFEAVRDLMAEVRHFKRPYLNTYGISLGYIKSYGLKEGYLDKNIRGFDGRLCFDLMKHGSIGIVRSNQAKPWTSTRTLQRDGSFMRAIVKRVLREAIRLKDYFVTPENHNTKESANADHSIENSLRIIKQKLNPLSHSKKVKQ